MKNFFLIILLMFFCIPVDASNKYFTKAFGPILTIVETKIDNVIFCGALALGGHAIYTAIKAWNERPLNNTIQELKGYTLNEMRFGPLNKKSFISFASMSEVQWHQLIDFLIDVYGQELARRSLVQQYNLYQFPKFVQIIRNWQEYKEINSDFIERVPYDWDVLNKLCKLQGFVYGQNLIEFIKKDLQ